MTTDTRDPTVEQHPRVAQLRRELADIHNHDLLKMFNEVLNVFDSHCREIRYAIRQSIRGKEVPERAQQKRKEIGKVVRVIVDFKVPVELSQDWQKGLTEHVDIICQNYKADHPDRTMWVFGVGSLITRFPMTQEEEKEFGIEFDDSVLHIDVNEREKTPDAKE